MSDGLGVVNEEEAMEALLNWLNATDKYVGEDGRIVYAGPSPFTFYKGDKEDMDVLMNRPWVISHPDAFGKLWRAVGLESFALMTISEGMVIGLVVEEWKDA